MEVKNKISKGKWLMAPFGDGIEIFVEGMSIARIPKTKGNSEEAEANAKLIALAPDLLESIQNLIGIFDTPIARRKYGKDIFYKEAIEFAKNTLNKI